MLCKIVLTRRNFSATTRAMSNEILKEIFLKSVSAVQPQQLIRNEVKVVNSIARFTEKYDDTVATTHNYPHLAIKGQSFPLPENCYMVGFGKAVLGMATEMEKLLGERLKRAVVSVPVGIFERFGTVQSKIEFLQGAKNNLPDLDALRAATIIKGFIEELKEDDLLIVLISGGGSALLPLPVTPITLEEKHELIKSLAGNGASINELNCVRKKISLLKGGGLAEIAYPCKIISLILSDIVGDPLDLIASGPTVQDNEPASRAIDILKKFQLYNATPESIKSVIGKQMESKNNCAHYEHVNNFVIGNNRIAAEASKKEAERQGFQSSVVSTCIEGDISSIAFIYAKLANTILAIIKGDLVKDDLEKLLRELSFEDFKIEDTIIKDILGMNFEKDICLIFAGEPTVVVKGNGKGGRNQQLALAFAAEIKKFNISCRKVSFLSCGTDGIDGPTDAAGAIAPVDAELASMEMYLDNNDAYTFFNQWDAGQNLVKIGHSGTNVMDIHVIILRK